MNTAFAHRQSAHCENGVVSNLLNHHHISLSEPMVFGIGSGLFFTYLPFIRVNFAPGFSYRPIPGLIFKRLTRRLHIRVTRQKFSSPEKARLALDEKIRQGVPVGLQVGVYHLTYFPDDYRFHFNAHNLVVYGKENGEYLISDPVMEYTTRLSEKELERARFAKGALAPKGCLYYMDHIPPQLDLENAIRKGIRQTCQDMLAPAPIIGVQAMRWLARNIKKWPDKIGVKKTNHYLGQLIRMQEEIGTGGGGFRFIYAAFLEESAGILQLPELKNLSAEMTAIGDSWRDFALNMSRVYKNRNEPDQHIYTALSQQLTELAAREEVFFRKLKKTI